MAKVKEELSLGELELKEFEKSTVQLNEDLKIRNQLKEIFQTCPEDEMFRNILEIILIEMKSQYGILGYIDEDGSLVCPYMTRDSEDPSQLPLCNIIFPRNKWDVFWSYAVKDKRTYCSNKTLQLPKRSLPINNALTVPIINNNEVIGLIVVGDKVTDYEEKDIKLLENIAQNIAPILYTGLQNDKIDDVISSDQKEILFIKELRKFDENDKNYRFIFETAANLLVLINRHGTIINCNDRIYDLLGYKKEEVLGRSMLDIIDTDYHTKAQERWKMIWNNEFSYNEEYKMISKDAQTIQVSVNSSELKPDNGGQNYMIWIINDITEYKCIEQKLLEERNRAEVYLDIMGSDINNMNQTITASSELLLLKPDLSEQYRKYIQNTLDQSHLISDLISNIRKLSELKRSDFPLETIDIFKILAIASERIQQKYPHQKIRINQSISESEALVKGNMNMVNAFYNILNNAIKFDRHDEVILDISHTYLEDDLHWKIEFKDNGPGVSDDMKERIFKRFEIGDEALHGSGLGLAVVHKIVTQCKGKVWVEDKVKGDSAKGSNFVLLLKKGDA